MILLASPTRIHAAARRHTLPVPRVRIPVGTARFLLALSDLFGLVPDLAPCLISLILIPDGHPATRANANVELGH